MKEPCSRRALATYILDHPDEDTLWVCTEDFLDIIAVCYPDETANALGEGVIFFHGFPVRLAPVGCVRIFA